MSRPPQQARDMVRSKTVRMRAKAHQHKRWAEAARRAGLTLSAWARVHLDRAARM